MSIALVRGYYIKYISEYYIKYTITRVIDCHMLHKGNFRDT